MNPLIASANGHAALTWDFCQPIESSLLRSMFGPFSSQLSYSTVYTQPATEPPLHHLTISCINLPWMIEVTAKPGAQYITVFDILHALHRSLSLGVTQAEWSAFDHTIRDPVLNAYTQRYRSIADPHDSDVERARGILRVDFLRDRRAFAGLSLVLNGLPERDIPPGQPIGFLHTAKL